MVDLNDIALFVKVVRAGSFAEAARRLGMPSNTVSRRIQAFERALGVRLLQRSTRKLTLTAAGATLHARSAEQVDALTDAAREAGDASGAVRGRIRVSASADFFRWFPVEWVAEFLAMHPAARIEFLLTDDKVNLIEQSIDVAIRAGVDSDSTLVARPIGTMDASLVATPAYLAERGMPATLAELSRHDCVALPRVSGTTTWKLIGPDGPEEVDVMGRFHANTLRALLDATLAGLGIGLMPSVVTAPYLREGQLINVLPAYRTPSLSVSMVYPSRRQLPRAVTTFMAYAMDRMQREGLVHP
jgi:LysR family transcriptional regulator AphB